MSIRQPCIGRPANNLGYTRTRIRLVCRESNREVLPIHQASSHKDRDPGDGFSVEIIDKASTIEELNALEEQYIAKYNTVNEGYNTTNGGDNREYTDVHKQILKDAWTKERRAVASERMKEQNERTKDTRGENISLGLKDYFNEFKKTGEFWEKNAKLQKGREEWRAKNPVMSARRFILEHRNGEDVEVVDLKAWCRDPDRPDYANLMGNYKRQKGWAKGWRIKEKRERVKPLRNK